MAILRIETLWSGGPGGSGMTVMHVGDGGTDPAAAIAAIGNFWGLIDNNLPDDISWTVNTTCDLLDETTGALIGEYVSGSGAPGGAGGAPGVWAAGVGSRIDWITGAIVAGRRLKGRTYVVPTSSAVMAVDGTLDTNWRNELQGAANTMVAALDTALFPLKVWHRPVNGAGGSAVDVTTASVPDKVAVLATRRR